MVSVILENNLEIRETSYQMLKTEITTATTSMTSIPRPLKFVKPHYESLKNYFAALNSNDSFRRDIADLLAVISQVVADTEDKSLNFLLQGNKEKIRDWGLEFVRNLSGEIGKEFEQRVVDKLPVGDLNDLVDLIVPYQIDQHSETEAIDLLIEVDRLADILQYVSERNAKKVSDYLNAHANFAADTEEQHKILMVSYRIHHKFSRVVQALRVAIKMSKPELIRETFKLGDDLTRKQMAFILAKHKIFIEDEQDETLVSIISNLKLTDYYKRLAKELEVTEPKHPEDVFKTHLEEGKRWFLSRKQKFGQLR